MSFFHQRHVLVNHPHTGAVIQQPGNAVPVFPGLLHVITGNGIAAGPGMGIVHREGLILLFQVLDDRHLDDVLENIGKVAGVVAVAIGKHGDNLKKCKGALYTECPHHRNVAG